MVNCINMDNFQCCCLGIKTLKGSSVSSSDRQWVTNTFYAETKYFFMMAWELPFIACWHYHHTLPFQSSSFEGKWKSSYQKTRKTKTKNQTKQTKNPNKTKHQKQTKNPTKKPKQTQKTLRSVIVISTEYCDLVGGTTGYLCCIQQSLYRIQMHKEQFVIMNINECIY